MAFHHLPEPSTGCLKAWLRCHHHPCGGLESCLKRGGNHMKPPLSWSLIFHSKNMRVKGFCSASGRTIEVELPIPTRWSMGKCVVFRFQAAESIEAKVMEILTSKQSICWYTWIFMFDLYKSEIACFTAMIVDCC